MSFHHAVVIIVAFALYSYVTYVEFPVHKEGIVLISGASSGIGKHAAEHLATMGYTVLAGVRKSHDLDDIKKTKRSNLVPVMLDVTDHESCVGAVEVVKETMGVIGLPLIAVIHNAG